MPRFEDIQMALETAGRRAGLDPACNTEVEKYASYPWDKCVSDRKADGYSDEQAQSICAAIKNRTVKHALEHGLVKTFEEGVALVTKRFKEDRLFAYLADQLRRATCANEGK